MGKRKVAPAKPEAKGWIAASGRKPVLAGFLPDEHETIRQAAFLERKSMTQFVHDSALAAAAKLIAKNS